MQSRCRGAEVQILRCRYAEVKRCRGAEVQRCRGAEVLRYRHSNVDMEVLLKCTYTDIEV